MKRPNPQINKYLHQPFKRKVPIIKIALESDVDFTKIAEVPEFKNIIMHELLVAVKDGINKKRKNIELFEISNTNLCLNLKKENWGNSLNEAMNYFTSIENYDKCIECRELIKLL